MGRRLPLNRRQLCCNVNCTFCEDTNRFVLEGTTEFDYVVSLSERANMSTLLNLVACYGCRGGLASSRKEQESGLRRHKSAFQIGLRGRDEC